MTDDESTTDKLAQDVVEGRHSEAWLLLTARERHDALLKRLRSAEWLAGATTKVVTLRPREIPFGEDDPHAPKSLTLGG